LKEVALTRGYQSNTETIGMLQIKGVPHKPIYTLENPWEFNKPYISCIPIGQYVCSPFSGNKYKAVYQVNDVKNRSYILLHSGNLPKDTSGCIILGLSAGTLRGEPAVLESRKAVDYFKSLIGHNDFVLRIGD
jgi:hypothetical protein